MILRINIAARCRSGGFASTDERSDCTDGYDRAATTPCSSRAEQKGGHESQSVRHEPGAFAAARAAPPLQSFGLSSSRRRNGIGRTDTESRQLQSPLAGTMGHRRISPIASATDGTASRRSVRNDGRRPRHSAVADVIPLRDRQSQAPARNGRLQVTETTTRRPAKDPGRDSYSLRPPSGSGRTPSAKTATVTGDIILRPLSSLRGVSNPTTSNVRQKLQEEPFFSFVVQRVSCRSSRSVIDFLMEDVVSRQTPQEHARRIRVSRSRGNARGW